MSTKTFIECQLLQIQQGGRAVLFGKMKQALQLLPKLPLYIPAVFMVRIIRPWLLVRWGGLISVRIGHLAGNTEMYFCERDAGINAPKQRYVDLFYMAYGPICNQQLATMWKRILHVWPSWILAPISLVNRLIPGGAIHEIGNNTQGRDVHNLLDRFPPHLEFTPEEEAHGEAGLRAMGILPGTPFVCLIVRDSAYLDVHLPWGEWNYHNYRDSDIQNYILAAEELAARGYFVIRMGAKVGEAMKTAHPRVIDYATNGMRSDYMDIYLSAKCKFFINGESGFCSMPMAFRVPIVFVNLSAIEYIFSWNTNIISIPKKYLLKEEKRFMTFKEIFDSGVGRFLRTEQYEQLGIELIENLPEEIAALAIEMDERLKGTWETTEEDEKLQRRFWDMFPKSELHGEIRARIGAHFLRNNRDLLR